MLSIPPARAAPVPPRARSIISDVEPRNQLNDDETRVNERIAAVRARRPKLRDTHVTLAHGAGGKASAALVDAIFFDGYGNEVLDQAGDAGVLPLDAFVGLGAGAHVAMSTDSYVVNPIEFPGGCIGELAGELLKSHGPEHSQLTFPSRSGIRLFSRICFLWKPSRRR